MYHRAYTHTCELCNFFCLHRVCLTSLYTQFTYVAPFFSMLLFRPCAMNLSYCIQNKWYSCLIMIDELNLNVEKSWHEFSVWNEFGLAMVFFSQPSGKYHRMGKLFSIGIYMALIHSFVKLKFLDTTVVVGITLNWWCVIICIDWICLAFIGRLIIILMYYFAESEARFECQPLFIIHHKMRFCISTCLTLIGRQLVSSDNTKMRRYQSIKVFYVWIFEQSIKTKRKYPSRCESRTSLRGNYAN